MRKRWKYYISIITITATLLVGCSSSQNSQVESETPNANNTENPLTTSDTNTISTSTVVIDKEFTASDLDVGFEESTATHITLSDTNIDVSGNGASSKDGILTINDEGTYVITGTITDGQIVVDAQDTDKLQIVLNGVSITCADFAPIYIKSADKVFITLQENTVNTLIDGTEYVQIDDKNVDGVIYSRADLTINGSGTLNITGNYKHGIISKDDLVITGGTFNITTVKDALNGKDCVKIKDGTFTLSSTTGNGIQSKNGDDTTKGYVYISGGNINVVKCSEGIEGTVIIIEDGTINVIADDDGFNAASGTADTTDTTNTTNTTDVKNSTDTTDTAADGKEPKNSEGTIPDSTTADNSSTNGSTFNPQQNGFGGKGQGGFGGGENPFEVDTNCYISIEGGNITIDASGDGIDSNGSLYISGGTLYLNGPTSGGDGGLDYNGTAQITGGTVIVVGSSGMAQGFSDTSTQYSLLYNLTADSEAGTEVKLTDSEGNVVISYIPNKQYQSVVISTPELKKDGTYTLTSGDQTADITLTSVVTSNGEQGMGGQGMGRPGAGGQGMARPDMEGQERPEGMPDMENIPSDGSPNEGTTPNDLTAPSDGTTSDSTESSENKL